MSVRRGQVLVRILAGLLFLEFAAVAGLTGYLVIEIFVSTPSSYTSAIALAVLSALFAFGLGLIVVGTVRGRPWIRGAAMVWQILQLLIAIGILQAGAAESAWLLIVPAVSIIVLLFTPSVVEATARRP